jgi:hypothetical protein
MSADIHEEIIVQLRNEPGAVAKVLKLIADAGVNIHAFCGYAMGPDAGAVHIMPDHAPKAKAALDAAHVKYTLSPALVIKTEDKPGTAASIAAKIAAKGVNVEHCYATGVGKGAGTIVVRTADNGRAKEALG